MSNKASSTNHKYLIIGLHASGKHEIAEDLIKNGIKVGKNFVSLPNFSSDIYLLNTVYYQSQDIDTMFESQAYIFMQKKLAGGESYYEGLSLYEYDNNSVFVMSPDQFDLIPSISSDVTIVWLDNNVSDRRLRYLSERRKYDFTKEENYERQDMAEFIDKINSSPNKVLYFNNEDPLRVSAIIYALVKNPELLKVFEERFN